MDWFEVMITVAGALAGTAWVWLVVELVHDAFVSPEPRDRVARPMNMTFPLAAREYGARCTPPSWPSPYSRPGLSLS